MDISFSRFRKLPDARTDNINSEHHETIKTEALVYSLNNHIWHIWMGIEKSHLKNELMVQKVLYHSSVIGCIHKLRWQDFDALVGICISIVEIWVTLLSPYLSL